MRKFITFLILISALNIVTVSVVSQVTTLIPTQTLKERKEEIRDEVKGLREERRDLRQNIKNQVKEKKEGVKDKLKGNGIKIVNGEVTGINGTTLTVSKDGKNYTVQTDSNIKFTRHFWGKSSFSEILVGNRVNVFGRFTDDTQTTIQAHLIRNLSVQKRHGVFMGEVLSLNSDGFVIKSVNRGNQTVVTGSTTKFIARNQTALTFSDVKVGHKIRVRGLWDKSLNKITEVTEIKDFSLPVAKVTKTPTPTP